MAKPRADALSAGSPVERIRVTVDDGVILMPRNDDLLELPHDDPAALRDFLECTYALYGWVGIRLIEEQLTMMLKLLENPDEVAHESGEEYINPPRRPGEPSGGVAGPTDASDAGAPLAVSGGAKVRTSEGLSGGVVLEEERPLPPGLTSKHLETRARYDELRRRMGRATTAQVRTWLEAFQAATADLRATVLSRMQSFEQKALDVARQKMDDSEELVLEQVYRYFEWKRRRDILAALAALHGKEVIHDQQDVKDLRVRIATLTPAAQAVVDAEEALQRFKDQHLIVQQESDLLPHQKKELERLRSEIPAKGAAYGAALVVEAAEHPVLYRFDAASLLKAHTPNDVILGSLVFIRLKKTWEAQAAIYEQLRKHQVAKAVKAAEVKEGAIPEALVGLKAKDSVWAYQRLLDKTLQSLPADQLAFAEIAVSNTRAAFEREEAEAAFRSMIAGAGLVAMQIGMMAACPPAGFLLDVALSASDVWSSAEEYEKESAEALCVLDPRESLRQDEPSMIPLILAVAGAAMVAL